MSILGQDGMGTPGATPYSNTIGANVANGGMTPIGTEQDGGPGALYGPDDSLQALSEVTPYVTRTTTGTAFTGACELAGYDCTAVTGTPTITIYDNTSAAGTVIVPATTLTVGRVEFAWKRALTTGCHVVLSGTQTVNVLVG